MKIVVAGVLTVLFLYNVAHDTDTLRPLKYPICQIAKCDWSIPCQGQNGAQGNRNAAGSVRSTKTEVYSDFSQLTGILGPSGPDNESGLVWNSRICMLTLRQRRTATTS